MNRNIVTSLVWQVFQPSFSKNISILSLDNRKLLMKNAKKEYFRIIKFIPKFKSNDVLLLTILNASILASIYRTLPYKPKIDVMREYYRKSMDENKIARKVINVKPFYTRNYIEKLEKQAQKSQKSINPYTWRFTCEKGNDINSFSAIFTQCGICNLYNKLQIFELVPALCTYDYDMAEYTNTIFTRETTIASGGQRCDCHYKKKISEPNN